MSFGLSEKVTGIIQAILCKYPAVERAAIYGSRAKGNYREGSDIDLTLFGDSLTNNIRNNIRNDLDDSIIPYTVDLSIFKEISNAALRDHICRVGRIFYEKATHPNLDT